MSTQRNVIGSPRAWNSDFIGYLKGRWKYGVNIDQQPLKYITEDDLKKYWTVEAVTEILNTAANELIVERPEIVVASYVRVWSTLVFIGCPEFITWFRNNERHDESLYANGLSEITEDDPLLQATLKEFSKHWSKFWPVRFQSTKNSMHRKELDSQRVLPIKFCGQLSRKDSVSSSIIYAVGLDPLCCEFAHTRVVFKIYSDSDPTAAKAFAKEVQIFDTAGGGAKDVIVEYLGSFIQNEKRVIILEHADGNLRTFFESHRGPRDNAELVYLWTALFKLADAVYHLHHPGGFASGITHRDIKFENILFFKKGDPDSYKFVFKLTDFDTSTRLQRIHGHHGRHDSGGSRTHCAPEASRIAEFTEDTLEELPLDSDVWQLGTVLSEALICILWDVKSLSTYENKRKQETSLHPELADSGLENCFHNGEKRLDCIQEIHQKALQSRSAFDRISAPVVALIEDEMLIPHEQGRAQPKFLSQKFGRLLDRSRRESVVTETLHQNPPKTPTRNHTVSGAFPVAFGPTHTEQEHLHDQSIRNSQSFDTIHSFQQHDGLQDQHNLASTNVMPHVRAEISNGSAGGAVLKNGVETNTGAEAAITRSDKERLKTPIPKVTARDVNLWRKNKSWKKGGAIPPELHKIIEELKGRDQLIVVDDAQSMKAHLAEIISAAEAIISLAKKADPDGVDLIFTSNPGEVKKKRTLSLKSETNDLVKQINNRLNEKLLPDNTNMENRLGTVLRRLPASGKDTSVYVLTDGVWMESKEPGGGVEGPIKNLISRLKKHSRDRDGVTIQFIRFGDDENGKRRLAWLDDELPKSEPGLKNFDIVDTRRHDENLYLLMIGALIRNVDDMK